MLPPQAAPAGKLSTLGRTYADVDDFEARIRVGPDFGATDKSAMID